jgi:hypothetical protein
MLFSLSPLFVLLFLYAGTNGGKMLLASPPWPPAESAGHQLHEKYTIK